MYILNIYIIYRQGIFIPVSQYSLTTRQEQQHCASETPDGVVAEGHRNRHVHQEGHQKAEGEEDTFDTE